jgi:hypothetical protein
MLLEEAGERLLHDRHRRVRRVGVHSVQHCLACRVGLAHQPVDEGVLVVGVERVERRGKLLRSVFVGALELVAQALEEPRDGAVLRERIERADELSVTIVHDPAELRLQHLDQALAVGRAELPEERARLADLPRECSSEYAILRSQVALEQMGEDPLVIDERGQALRDLPVLRVEELPKHGGDRLLLASDVRPELPVDVIHEGPADVPEPRFLRQRVRVGEGAQPDGPGIRRELMRLLVGEFAEEV